MLKVSKIAYVYLRYQFLPYFMGGLFICLCLPLVASFKNLELGQSALLIERIFTLIGLVMMMPLFTPDLDKGALSVVYTRRYPYLGILVVRLLIQLLSVSLILLLILLSLKNGQSELFWGAFFIGGLSNVVFLGGLGLIIYSFFDQPILATMVPILYYVANLGGSKYFGKLFLFSLASGGLESKRWLAIVGVLLITFSLLWREHRGSRIQKP